MHTPVWCTDHTHPGLLGPAFLRSGLGLVGPVENTEDQDIATGNEHRGLGLLPVLASQCRGLFWCTGSWIRLNKMFLVKVFSYWSTKYIRIFNIPTENVCVKKVMHWFHVSLHQNRLTTLKHNLVRYSNSHNNQCRARAKLGARNSFQGEWGIQLLEPLLLPSEYAWAGIWNWEQSWDPKSGAVVIEYRCPEHHPRCITSAQSGPFNYQTVVLHLNWNLRFMFSGHS